MGLNLTQVWMVKKKAAPCHLPHSLVFKIKFSGGLGVPQITFACIWQEHRNTYSTCTGQSFSYVWRIYPTTGAHTIAQKWLTSLWQAIWMWSHCELISEIPRLISPQWQATKTTRRSSHETMIYFSGKGVMISTWSQCRCLTLLMHIINRYSMWNKSSRGWWNQVWCGQPPSQSSGFCFWCQKCKKEKPFYPKYPFCWKYMEWFSSLDFCPLFLFPLTCFISNKRADPFELTGSLPTKEA